jgi:hypothetical protein
MEYKFDQVYPEFKQIKSDFLLIYLINKNFSQGLNHSKFNFILKLTVN